MEIDTDLQVLLEKGPKKKSILILLSKEHEPRDSTFISKIVKMQKNNVIKILNVLEEKEAIKCVTDRRRDRRFAITHKGKFHLTLLKHNKRE